MPRLTRRNKEKNLLFSYLVRLERSIRKERRAESININSTSSTDTYERPTIDTSTWTLININPWEDMVATLVLIRDENGDMHDQDGQRSDDDQRDVIHDPEAANPQAANAENDAANAQAVAEENVQTARPRTLGDYNRPNKYYANILVSN